MKFRERSELIEAFKMGVDPIPDWFMDKITNRDATLLSPTDGKYGPFEHMNDTYCIVKSQHGNDLINHGDYVVQKDDGLIYCASHEIFERDYEPVIDTIQETIKPLECPCGGVICKIINDVNPKSTK